MVKGCKLMYNTIVNNLLKNSNPSSIEYDVMYELRDFKRLHYLRLVDENKKRIGKFGKKFIQEMKGQVGDVLDLLIQESIRNEVVYRWQKLKKEN